MFCHFRHAVRSGILIAAVLATHTEALPAQDADPRAPVPDSAARKDVLALVQEIHGKEYEDAKTSSQKLALAKTLLSEAGESQDDPAGHFVLLRVARDLAVGAGDTSTAWRAIDVMDRAFQVDGLQMKAGAISKLTGSARSAVQKKGLALLGLRLIGELVLRDDYDAARQLGKTIVTAGRKSKDAAMEKRITARNKQVERLAAAYADVQDTLATLEEHPVDPDANLAAGKYYCFVKGDWGKGASMLALGQDATLRELARQELREVTSPSRQVKLGNDWWDVAQAADEETRDSLLLHAATWYRRAQSKLSGGLVKTKIKKRLAGEIAEVEQEQAMLAGGTELAILDAKWGAHDGWLDGAAELQAAVTGSQVHIGRVIQGFKKDPAPGQHKAMIIVYRCWNELCVAIVPAETSVSLPDITLEEIASAGRSWPNRLVHQPRSSSRGGLTILYAGWGGYKGWLDVTDRARSAVRGGRLVVSEAGTGFSDPAPGHRKALVIVYSFRGKVHTAIVPSGKKILLPPY